MRYKLQHSIHASHVVWCTYDILRSFFYIVFSRYRWQTRTRRLPDGIIPLLYCSSLTTVITTVPNRPQRLNAVVKIEFPYCLYLYTDYNTMVKTRSSIPGSITNIPQSRKSRRLDVAVSRLGNNLTRQSPVYTTYNYGIAIL